MKEQKGLTLVELMVVLVIVAILVAAAGPGLMQLVRSNKTQTIATSFVAAVNYARTESLKRNLPVGMCISSDGAACTAGTDWGLGSLVYVDENLDGDKDAADDVLKVFPAVAAGYTLTATTASEIFYRPDGSLSAGVTFGVCDPGKDTEIGQTITIDVVGRPYNTKTVASCPS